MQLSPAILSLLKKPIGMYSRLLLETLGIKIKFEDGVNKILEDIDYWKNSPLWDKKSIEKATNSWFKYLN